MTNFISPEQYDKAEQEGLRSLACRTIECFRPWHFAAVGYPFKIDSIDELWKYTECMHDGMGFTEPMDKYLVSTLLAGGFTNQELEEVRSIKTALDDLSRSIGRPVEFPGNSMFLALNQARHISALAPPGATIVELGGGAGYLGALLTLRGYRYIATDVAQVFYILQCHLLGRLSRGRFIDLADPKLGSRDLQELQPGQAGMVPWWRWAQRKTFAGLSFDLATSNHNFLEMHPYCRLYHLSVIREALSPNATGIVFEGWGDPSRNPTWTAVKDFSDKGFVLAHNDNRITCFVPKHKYSNDVVLNYPLPFKPSAPETVASAVSEERRTNMPKTWRRLTNAVLRRLLADVDGRFNSLSLRVDGALSKINAWNPNESYFAVPTFSHSDNPITQAIQLMRNEEGQKLQLRLEDYKKYSGANDLTTEDERFLAYSFRDTVLARPWVTTLPN
jgi:hypothetical protein